jgi:hypothetical protein
LLLTPRSTRWKPQNKKLCFSWAPEQEKNTARKLEKESFTKIKDGSSQFLT